MLPRRNLLNLCGFSDARKGGWGTECELEAVRSGDHPHILVVEDEPLIRFAIADALRDEGLVVIEAASGDEAWQQFQLDPDIAVVFTDYRMPGAIDGAKLAALATSRNPAVLVVLTSGDFDGEGYSGPVLRKPYDVNEIAQELARMARSKRKAMDA